MEGKQKILMALMGLEIGGAETHVLELSKELKRRGYDIIVASNGGVYEKELLEAGIKHFKVPLNKRNIINILKSYLALRDIISKEKVDIVHSHARIPSFVCGLLYKRLKFTFITSTHGVYYTGMGLKYLTNWGQKVIAVSADINDYLIKNYKVRNSDIFVTINGIDTERFSPSISGNKIRAEFGLSENNNVLLYVSRMEESCDLTARQLIELAPRLREEIKDIKIILVGDGDSFLDLKGQAEAINEQFSERLIYMPGARTDVNEFIAVSTLFVGVSRSALEAMSGERTVILAGAQGYTGIFSKDNLRSARETNFCCRDCLEPNTELLFKDIKKAFNELTSEDRQRLGAYGREVIFKYYSVSKMTDDCILAYEAGLRQTRGEEINVLMSGYYGFNNLGDEAILTAMHKNIAMLSNRLNITVLSNNPDQTRKRHNVNAIYRFGLFNVMSSVSKCDVLLSGGGSLLQDTTSTRSLLYYLSIILLAKLMRKKVMLYANGIGPVSKKQNKGFVHWVLNKADIITLREENSYDELIKMGVNNKNTYVTADPVFTLDGISKNDALDIFKLEGIPTTKPIIGVSVRSWKHIEDFSIKLASLCDKVAKNNDVTIVFIVMQQSKDKAVSQRVMANMKEKAYILDKEYSPREMMGIISLMSIIISMRLHTLIFAARVRVPLLGFIYDPKIEYYLEKFNMPSGGTVESFDFDGSYKAISDMLKNRKKYVAMLDEKASRLTELAEENEEYLKKLIGL